MTRARSRYPGLVAGFLLLFSMASVTFGQQAALPSGIQEVGTLSPDQQSQIREYIRSAVTLLGSEDLRSRRAGRDRLLEMFDATSISVAFRLECSQALIPEIRKMLSSQRDWDRFAGYRIAAKVASDESASVFATAINGPAKADRLMALGQLRVLFHEVRKSDTPAVYPDTLTQLAQTLGRSLAEETDADVTLYQVRALRSLAEASSPRIAVSQKAALTAMCDATGARVARQQASSFRGSDNELIELLMYLEAVDAVRAIVAMSAGSPLIDEASMRAIGGLTGELLAFASRAYPDLPRDGTERRHVERLTQRSVEVLRVLSGQYNEQSPRAIDIASIPGAEQMVQWLAANNMREFRIAVIRVVGEGGVLTRAPFGFAASRFRVQ